MVTTTSRKPRSQRSLENGLESPARLHLRGNQAESYAYTTGRTRTSEKRRSIRSNQKGLTLLPMEVGWTWMYKWLWTGRRQSLKRKRRKKLLRKIPRRVQVREKRQGAQRTSVRRRKNLKVLRPAWSLRQTPRKMLNLPRAQDCTEGRLDQVLQRNEVVETWPWRLRMRSASARSEDLYCSEKLSNYQHDVYWNTVIHGFLYIYGINLFKIFAQTYCVITFTIGMNV